MAFNENKQPQAVNEFNRDLLLFSFFGSVGRAVERLQADESAWGQIVSLCNHNCFLWLRDSNVPLER